MRLPAALLSAAALAVAAPAQAESLKPVRRNLVKVGVEKVLTVQLAAEQPGDAKVRDVVITLAATAARCLEPEGEVFGFPEGEFEGFEYYSYWAPGADGCAAGPVDIAHVVRLPVGETRKFALVGASKFNQLVSFRVDAGGVGGLLIKKGLAR